MAMSPSASSLLLVGVLGIVALAVALLLSTVLLPQGTSALVLVVGAGAFLLVQLAIFRLLRLRSAADGEPGHEAHQATDLPGESAADGPPGTRDSEASSDWRAWRG